MWHYTTESILPILDYRSVMEKGDSVLLPDFPSYPIDLVKRILPDCVSARVGPAFIPKKFLSCYLAATGVVAVRKLCEEMLTFVEKKPVPTGKPVIFMNFRLHKRRWLPFSNMQTLIDRLKDKYTILLSLNPICEKIGNVPEITDVIKIYNLSYEEQLSYAMAADYAIYGNGAGMIFPRLVGIPSVMITPCLITETSLIGLYYGDNMIALSDKRPDTEVSWNFDIEKVSVDSVMEAFEKITKLPRS